MFAVLSLGVVHHMTDLDTPLAADGSERANGALHALVAACVETLPGRLRSAYVTGSFADGSALATSDLDVTLAFSGVLTLDERRAAESAAQGVVRRCSVELDVGIADEDELVRGVPPLLKLGGRCVWGEDRRDAMPLIPIEQLVRERMHAAYWLIVNVFGRPAPVSLPLGYPDAGSEFFGYTRRTVRLPDGCEVPSTRDLIRVTGWAATALVALRGRAYVARKRELPTAYREHVGDEHAALHEKLARWCRECWGYLIPTDAADRVRLRDFCARTLSFENRFLAAYREWLLGELRAAGCEAHDAARWMLGRVPLADDEIASALQGDRR